MHEQSLPAALGRFLGPQNWWLNDKDHHDPWSIPTLAIFSAARCSISELNFVPLTKFEWTKLGPPTYWMIEWVGYKKEAHKLARETQAPVEEDKVSLLVQMLDECCSRSVRRPFGVSLGAINWNKTQVVHWLVSFVFARRFLNDFQPPHPARRREWRLESSAPMRFGWPCALYVWIA